MKVLSGIVIMLLSVALTISIMSRFPETEKKYIAVGNIVSHNMVTRDGHLSSHKEIRQIGFKTGDTFFIIPFRSSENVLWDTQYSGELHYHSCGDNQYCFDYWKSIVVKK